MAVEGLEALATDFLEHQNFVCLGIVVEDGGLDHCTLNVRITDFDGVPVFYEEAWGRRCTKSSFPASTLNCWPAISTIAYIKKTC